MKPSAPFERLLPPEVEIDLYSLNPHWQGKPGPLVPKFRRWIFPRLLRSLLSGITPAVVLRGPRRVGKTVLLRQLIEELLARGVDPRAIFYVAFDELESLRNLRDPILRLAWWYEREILGRTFNELAREGKMAYLLLDEVQNLEAWAPQLKHLVDNHSLRVLVTGSSSLRIEAGRDSLAGRITTLEIGPFLLREIAGLRFGLFPTAFWPDNGLEAIVTMDFWRAAVIHAEKEAEIRRQAFTAFSERGGYPEAQERFATPWPEMADYLNETVIMRAIRHDLRLGPRGAKREARLLEEVFRLCCRYAGQSPGPQIFVPALREAYMEDIAWSRILNYLRFLDGSLLLRLIRPLELRLKRPRSAPKICLCDHALRASWLQEVIPLHPEGLLAEPHLCDLAGRLAESTLGYFLGSIPHLDLAHFPARGLEPEVDFILTIGTKRIPVEVKYRRRIDPHEDTLGLRAFLEKTVYNAPFGLLVTMEDGVKVPDPRIIPISLSALLWLR